jgi:hypothetical protein
MPSTWLRVALGSAALLACSEAAPPSTDGTAARPPAPRAAAPLPAAGATARDSTWVDVTGPTLIAFFPPEASALLDSGGDDATALDDFGYHLASATDSLRALGVRVVGVGSRTLHVVADRQTTHFRVPQDSAEIGYYFVAPGRRPLVAYGVLTDSELIDAARQHFFTR